ncbi:MAG: DEAD/DEAH box helicase family protein [Thermomicrobiales bacterium]|nr:DEAD/DEAH box helicase family protein [Thermomicrobiales bacterium]
MAHPQVNAIAGRLSLRPPQRRALEILDRVTEVVPPRKGIDVDAALAVIQDEFPSVRDFERDFPSLCFALATGVGKTRLMGAFISYLHLAHQIDNFFVLAPNLTIYNKLIADFTPGSPKYVFTGIGAFATQPPEIITGDTYESHVAGLFDLLIRCKVNIFNISKINSEVRGGKSPRIKRLSEYLGESYFAYLAALPDLVLLMDESHRYRASAGVRAINELQPILGLELTATPYVSAGKQTTPFQNVVLDYPLCKAMEDGFVKEPAVVTRQSFDPSGMSAGELERLKLEDGIRLHEQTKVQLETYAREQGVAIVKPFVLVIARDTTHAAELLALIQRDDFFDGRYRDKVIQVDSSGSGAERDEVIERLLKVERDDEPTEIVIHVNMLKEGWDVTNLYTIVPLRAANARVLIEQTIGRGLRLPYGKRTGVKAVDRLTIVAHDRFQEIVDAANDPRSPIQLESIVLDPEELARTTTTVVSQPNVETRLGIAPDRLSESTTVATDGHAPAFNDPEEAAVARLAYKAIQKLQRNPDLVPDVAAVETPEVRARLVREVEAEYRAGQLGLEGMAPAVDVPAIVEKTASLVVDQTISIPRITVIPVSEVRSGFRPFTLDLSSVNPLPVADTLWLQHLRTGEGEAIGLANDGFRESRLEDYVVSGLIEFDDVAYDGNADLLYDLAGQMVRHLRSYLAEEEAEKVLRVYQRELARIIHAQMQDHFWEDDVEYETKVNSGFSAIRPVSYTQSIPPMNFRVSPADKSNMAKYLFTGFQRCLHPVQKFQSDPERVLAVILDRDTLKWFKPATGQFQITYRRGATYHDYQPDFVAELEERIVMLEPKARNQMTDLDVLAKQTAAVAWCRRATDYAAISGGKPWSYALIPHDAIGENWSLRDLLNRWLVTLLSASASS